MPEPFLKAFKPEEKRYMYSKVCRGDRDATNLHKKQNVTTILML